jgi:hypothetical protein
MKRWPAAPHYEDIAGPGEMLWRTFMSTATQLASGLGGAIGSDFRNAQQQLIFVEYATGKLSALNLFPAAAIVAQSTNTVLKGTWSFDFDTGNESAAGADADVFWEQETAVARRMAPQNGAKIINLGAVNFATLTAANLQSLPYTTTPIIGNDDATNRLTVNDVFAVQTTKGNYAKVQVLAYGYDLTIKWVTYNIGSGYTVLGTGYHQPEDVKLSTDGVHAYITERTGDLVRIALSSPNRSAATVIASGMTAPQQMYLDEVHNAAYVVEYASPGRLLKIDLTTGAKTPIAIGLVNPVGVVLSSDLQYAYVSEQTIGTDLGRISSIQLSSGTRTTLAKGLTAPFFLTWADDAEDALLVPQRNPSNSILSVNVTSGATNIIATGLPSNPSSVALPLPGEMLICCDAVIEEVNFTLFALNGPLLIGIGLVPFDRVNIAPGPTQGMANTSVDVDPPYYVDNAPFGGTLPIMVNFQTAANAGASYYQVLVDGVPRTDSWTNYKWNGTANVLQTINISTVGPSFGCYPVHPVSELMLWESPALGDMLDTRALANGLRTIVLNFLDAAGDPIPGLQSAPLTILVNNQMCVATLSAPVLNLTPPTTADVCGVLHYGTSKTTTVSMGFTASQPANDASYAITIVRGGTLLTLTPPLPSGPVSSAGSSVTAKVGDLLGSCPIAGFAAELYVAASMTNGYGRQSQYDAEALMGFVLTP